VADLGEGRVGSVRDNSIAPLDQRLRSLRLPFGEHVTSADFLVALRGEDRLNGLQKEISDLNERRKQG